MTYLLLSVVLAGLAFAATRRVISPIIVFAVTLVASFVVLPTLSFGFWGLPGLFMLATIVVAVEEGIRSDSYISSKEPRWLGAGIMIAFAAIWLLVVPALSTWAFLHASSYRDLIGEVKESTFSTDTAPVDPAHVRIVDQSLAWTLGDKQLGLDPGLGSQVDLGAMNIQMYNGQLCWVGPLNHSGFFRWWANTSGTPGYVMVSASNDKDIKMIRELNGQPIRLRFNKGAYWGDDPERYLYQNGYSTVGLTDFTFEIDDEGRPFWVVTKYTKRVGFGGNDATGVVVLNAQTGDIEEYSVDEAPAWIDRIQPEDFVISQLDDWGRYVHGYWNSTTFGKRDDTLTTTPGMSLVYGNDGRSYWYTGMSSIGADQGTIGFVLVDTRTKAARLYKQAGATETVARHSAEGSVQEKGYVATDPILYNVGGVPTYFTTLKDSGGLVKLVAWVSVENYNIVGIGETAAAALQIYRSALYTRGNDIAPAGAVQTYELRGRVMRIDPVIRGGNTYYSLLLAEQPNKLFSASADLSPELVNTHVGDVIIVHFQDGGNPVVDMLSFDNTAYALQKTDAQIGVEARAAGVMTERQARQGAQNAEATRENLPPEEKVRLIQQTQQQ